MQKWYEAVDGTQAEESEVVRIKAERHCRYISLDKWAMERRLQ